MYRDFYFLLTCRQLWECASVLFSIRCTRELLLVLTDVLCSVANLEENLYEKQVTLAILTALMCGRIPSNRNSILFNVNSHELIKRTYYFNCVLYCAIAFRFIVDELWSICNSHEHWIN